MPRLSISAADEQLAFEATVKEIEEWWQTPRQSHIKRPYSAQRVASLRPSLPTKYASSEQALKLWKQLNEHLKNGTHEMTFGTTEPTIVSQMAKHLQTVYVSGALCGFSEVAEPGMDHADYPWDTVPKVVDKIFRSQQWHDQKQHHFRMLHPVEQRDGLENWDYMAPIIADGDMGFGGSTSTIKMTKLFVDSGVAMFHLDDLASGKKRFTIGQGRTVVPFSEYIDRLTAARLQIDIMGAETMLLCRCDVDHSEFITDIIDPRDHEYVQGATVPIASLVDTLREAAEAGDGLPLLQVRAQWMKDSGLSTFDEAVKAVATEQEYTSYVEKLGKGTVPLKTRRAIAAELVSKPIFFDWDLARSRDGQYFYKSNVKAIVERAIAAAPLGDVTWARMDLPKWDDLVSFHTQVREVYPDRLFAFGYTGDYDFPKAGFSTEAIKTFGEDLAKLGVVWQVQPIWCLQGLNLLTEQFSKLWRERGLEGYLETVQKPALATVPLTDGFEKASYCGSYLADAFFDTLAARDFGEGSSGKTISAKRQR
ncbi:isocitrate lyase-4 [Coleophoma crateriformis]|uniref:Isocitrate lyase n=1 Tax=Coleophoma crateriformis TaxID=565419 RepID=A0A3D8S2H5_9HELO|nr:isocitrate lyase-4 [Coleophoma crateriformis]